MRIVMMARALLSGSLKPSTPMVGSQTRLELDFGMVLASLDTFSVSSIFKKKEVPWTNLMVHPGLAAEPLGFSYRYLVTT